MGSIVIFQLLIFFMKWFPCVSRVIYRIGKNDLVVDIANTRQCNANGPYNHWCPSAPIDLMHIPCSGKASMISLTSVSIIVVTPIEWNQCAKYFSYVWKFNIWTCTMCVVISRKLFCHGRKPRIIPSSFEFLPHFNDTEFWNHTRLKNSPCIYPTSVMWLIMSWRRREPQHIHPSYQLISPDIFQLQKQKS